MASATLARCQGHVQWGRRMRVAAQQGDCDELHRAFDASMADRATRAVHSALRLAAINDHVGAVTWLLERGARLVEFPPSDISVAAAAAFYGSLNVLKTLVGRGGHALQAVCHHECVTQAIASTRPDVVEFLLAANACPNDACGRFPHIAHVTTAVEVATEEGSADTHRVVQLLLDAKAETGLLARHQPLQRAVMSGSVGLVQMLLRAKVDVNGSPILNYVGKHACVASALLQAKADIRRARLECCVEYPGTLELLVSAKAEVQERGDKLVLLADYANRPQSVRVLLEAGAHASAHTVRTLLDRAAATVHGARERVRIVTCTALKDVCTRSMLDWALETASVKCNTDAAVALLEAGADPGRHASRAFGLLHHACTLDRADFVQPLLAAKAAPSFRELADVCCKFGSDSVLALLGQAARVAGNDSDSVPVVDGRSAAGGSAAAAAAAQSEGSAGAACSAPVSKRKRREGP